MTKYITIESWNSMVRIQSNKPTRWQKLLARLRLKPLPKPLYWFECVITITCPNPLKTGDVILLRNLKQYHVMFRLHQNHAGTLESFKISSIEPTEQFLIELGKTVILATACGERSTNFK